jgi:hypothetical protein
VAALTDSASVSTVPTFATGGVAITGEARSAVAAGTTRAHESATRTTGSAIATGCVAARGTDPVTATSSRPAVTHEKATGATVPAVGALGRGAVAGAETCARATRATVAQEAGVAAIPTLAVETVAAVAAVAHQQAAAAAVLTRAAVGAVADQQAAVLARFVAVADEHRERGTEDADRIDGRPGSCDERSRSVADDGRRRMAEDP